MVLLEKGITGFNACSTNDLKAFRKACYSVRESGWKLLTIASPDIASYFYAHVIYDGQNGYLFLNRYYPVIALTNALLCNEKQFIDIPETLSKYFMAYDAVSSDILNAPFMDTGHHLSHAELQEIHYWNPPSVGNIIFNEWD